MLFGIILGLSEKKCDYIKEQDENSEPNDLVTDEDIKRKIETIVLEILGGTHDSKLTLSEIEQTLLAHILKDKIISLQEQIEKKKNNSTLDATIRSKFQK